MPASKKKASPSAVKTTAKKKSAHPPQHSAAKAGTPHHSETIHPFKTAGTVDSVRIRMYCHGFGDCFLLSFLSNEQVVYRMLIDCGQLTGSTEPLQAAIEDIAAECGGSLNLVVQTHEHKDHVSGFNLRDKQKNLLWDQIEVDNVWLAWTEKTGKNGDPLAIELREKQAKKKAALTRALGLYKQHINHQDNKTQLQNQYLGDDYYAAQQRYATALQQMLNFYDISAAEVDAARNGLPAGEIGLTIREAMSYFVERNKTRNKPDLFYWNPGDLADAAATGVQGVNFYFLGPPRDYKKLQVMEDKQHVEMYLAEMGLTDNFYLPLTTDSTEEGAVSPFKSKYFLQKQHRTAGQQKDPLDVVNLYEDQGWRRIEVDWLNNAGALALNLDSYTNNTSLVIAIELEASGKVLLFPADAQIGNWISWTEANGEQNGTPHLQWQKAGSGEKQTAADLLKRTVFYKVGHHASHNGTARTHGLELMESPELVAMIPVDEEVAKKQGKKGWKMPAGDLYEHLKQKTRGRIIRADKGNILENPTEEVPQTVRGTRVQQQQFKEKITYAQKRITTDDGRKRPLYIEYLVS